MATMTLQRATQIANRIRLETTFEQRPDEDEYGYRRRQKKAKATFVTNVDVNIDGKPREVVDTLRQDLQKRKTMLFKLMEIGTRLRTSIAVKQAEGGINALVTERVMVVEQIKMLDALLSSVETAVFDGHAFDARVLATQSRLSNATTGAASASINTPLLTKEDRDNLQSELRDRRSRQFEIDDQLSAKNATNMITVSDGDLSFLREAGYA
jgi:hypothetical protein